MKDPHDVVLSPIITERSIDMVNDEHRFQFRVALESSKVEIARAIEQIYQKDKIKVVKVNTVVVKGKRKRLGQRPPGKRPDWKKAAVQLAPGQSIPDFTV